MVTDLPLTIPSLSVWEFHFLYADFDQWVANNCPLIYRGRSYTFVAPSPTAEVISDIIPANVSVLHSAALVMLKVVYEYAGYMESGGAVSKLTKYLHRHRKDDAKTIMQVGEEYPIILDIYRRWALTDWADQDA